MGSVVMTSVNLRPDVYADQVRFCRRTGVSWNALIALITLWVYRGPKGVAICKWAHLSMEGKKCVTVLPGGRVLKKLATNKDVWGVMRRLCDTYSTTVTAILEAAWEPFREAHYYWDPPEESLEEALQEAV